MHKRQGNGLTSGGQVKKEETDQLPQNLHQFRLPKQNHLKMGQSQWKAKTELPVKMPQKPENGLKIGDPGTHSYFPPHLLFQIL